MKPINPLKILEDWLGTRGSKADFVNFEEIVGHSAALNVAASQGDTICRIPQTPKAISRF